MTSIKVTNNKIRQLFDAVKESCGSPLGEYLQYRSSIGGIATFEFTKKADEESVNFLVLKFDLPMNTTTHGNL